MQAKRPPWGYIIPVIIILIVIVGVIYVQSRNNTNVTTTAIGPENWPFSCLGQTNLFEHIHPWLRISIDGQNVVIPAAIGAQAPQYSGNIVVGSSCFMPLHTHDSSGIIHIETTTNANYTLADFFDIWAQSYAYVIWNGEHLPITFNSTDLFGLKTNATDSLTVLINGKPQSQVSSIILNTLDYCDSSNAASTSSPCFATVSQGQTGAGNPAWNGGQSPYPYPTNQTVQIVYGPP